MSERQATLRRFTRRRFLGTGLVVGIGTVLLPSRITSSQRADEVEVITDGSSTGFYKGMCYSAFPRPYDPSTANRTCIFFGSDIAYDPMAPLWGAGYTSSTGMRFSPGRNDLQTMKDMGVTLIRLYDWEPRNRHLNFLNNCNALGIKILAPVSNYFLKPRQGFEHRATLIPELIKSFSNAAGTDYHSAIAGIIIGNEPHLNGFDVHECSVFTKDWVEKEAQIGFASQPLIGHPVDFGKRNEPFPQWHFWHQLLEKLGNTKQRDLRDRLFLAPQPQNDATYLFENAEGSGKGYVPATYEKFKRPLLFTELGHDRTKPNYLTVVDGQLKQSIAYGAQHPEQLLGVCHFQFDDKVWKCPTGDPTGGSCDSEGSFGVFSHTDKVLITVIYVPGDFTHFDIGGCDNEQLRPDMLTPNPVYATIVANYK